LPPRKCRRDAFKRPLDLVRGSMTEHDLMRHDGLEFAFAGRCHLNGISESSLLLLIEMPNPFHAALMVLDLLRAQLPKSPRKNAIERLA
jgi:hypothetical protein